MKYQEITNLCQERVSNHHIISWEASVCTPTFGLNIWVRLNANLSGGGILKACAIHIVSFTPCVLIQVHGECRFKKSKTMRKMYLLDEMEGVLNCRHCGCWENSFNFKKRSAPLKRNLAIYNGTKKKALRERPFSIIWKSIEIIKERG